MGSTFTRFDSPFQAVIYFATEAARFWQPPVIFQGASAVSASVIGSPLSAAAESGLVASLGQQEAMADTFLVLGASLFLSRVARPLWRAPMLAVADRTALGSAGGHRSDGVSGGLTSLFYTLISTAIAKATASASGASKDSLIVSLSIQKSLI